MRRAIVRAALISVVLTGTAQAANRQQPSRRIELISMTALPTVDSEAVAAPTSDVGVDATLPAEFAVHDLSRRYVEFRMKRELAGLVEASPLSQPTFAAIPTSSSIAVPGWMRANIQTVAAPAFVPGCAPLAYRPSGFLSQEAEGRRAAYYGMMSSIACEHGIPTGLFDAMIIRESRYNPLAVSSKNAFGFAQLMPGTASWLGVNRFDPQQNMRGGARYLRQQLDKFRSVELALAAYNAGPGRVRDGLVPKIKETQAYVTNVVGDWVNLTTARSFQPSASIGPNTLARKVVVQTF
ncbi:lytic transglycosylase domain-containing protein [Sphingomonas sp. BK235]|uniref:lytic transglycosylase domain-containing protein n=1 Tax=Sphingomonas sp. BK235 TaxID=2512131 RepID=UPI0010EA7167|nr:lytic transglycosylase domain-containing protein [Sphingomonas sp. BK235]TCP30392.1 transglycosylase-like protein with SLT domain [Sphingomonas sp. BK235]